VIDGPRFTVAQMRRRDWVALSDALPREHLCNDFQRALQFFAWGDGWQRLAGLPGDESGRRYLRQIRKGLAEGPYQAGPFRVERAGRWGIVFYLDPMYALSRSRRRRRGRIREAGFPWHSGKGQRRRLGARDAESDAIGPPELSNV